MTTRYLADLLEYETQERGGVSVDSKAFDTQESAERWARKQVDQPRRLLKVLLYAMTDGDRQFISAIRQEP